MAKLKKSTEKGLLVLKWVRQPGTFQKFCTVTLNQRLWTMGVTVEKSGRCKNANMKMFVGKQCLTMLQRLLQTNNEVYTLMKQSWEKKGDKDDDLSLGQNRWRH